MEPAKAEHPSGNTAEKLLRVVQELVGEVHPHRPSSELITLDSAFEKDLGLDSLARVELISRVEKQFELALPERTFAEAETPRDLLRALLGAGGPRTALSAADTRPIQLGEAGAAPAEAQTLVEVLDWHVAHHPDRPLIQIYQDEDQGEIITYHQLATGARRLAAGL